MSQQFEFGDWVEYLEESDGPWKEGRYVLDDGSENVPLMIENPLASMGHDWCKRDWIRPHPTKKREAFATLSVTHNAPIVLTGIALESAKQFIELAIKANNGGFNG